MKTLLIMLLVLGTSHVFAQNTNTINKGIDSTNIFPPNTPESDSLKAITIHNDSINYKISLIDANLNSIQIKWDFIMGIPEEKLEAESNGWFTDMTAIIASLNEERQLLVESLK